LASLISNATGIIFWEGEIRCKPISQDTCPAISPT